jgi:hypothetical protein
MDQRALDQYYNSQAQGYFSGPVVQQGHGLGGLFSTLIRTLAPVARAVTPVIASAAKRGAKAVATQALRTGAQVAQDLLAGEDFTQTMHTRGHQAAKRLTRKGLGYAQRNMTRSRARARTRRAPRTIAGRARRPSRRKTDILDHVY